VQHRLKLPVHVEGKGVQRLRPVEQHGADAAVATEQDVLITCPCEEPTGDETIFPWNLLWHEIASLRSL
jgi:hypothetical protein